MDVRKEADELQFRNYLTESIRLSVQSKYLENSYLEFRNEVKEAIKKPRKKKTQEQILTGLQAKGLKITNSKSQPSQSNTADGSNIDTSHPT